MSGGDYSSPHRLPNRRGDREPANPFDMPRQRRGTTPQNHGRYPDYDVMEQAPHWDEVTRRVIERRAGETPRYEFFEPDEVRILGAFCDTVMAQDAEPRIPVLAMIDRFLSQGKQDGFRYADMPEDRDTWRRVAVGLEEEADRRYGEGFAALREDRRVAICEEFAAGRLKQGIWRDLPCARAWSVVMRAVLSQFYAHPWAWNEIGYGGPAYPRGYMRLGAGQHEPYERLGATGEDPVEAVRRKGLR